MEDNRIVELYWQREEAAIAESAKKYGRYCHYIAENILFDRWESEECVNDTWIGAWNAMPPHRPTRLSVFLGKITRNLALDVRARKRAEKRGRGQAALALEELTEVLSDNGGDLTEEIALKDALNRFLHALPQESMIVFLQRYWYFASIKDIAKHMDMSENNVKVMLHRLRAKCKAFLEKEGINL